MNFNNKIEVLINLFTIVNGDLKILLFKKKDEPFKGYWMLPSNLMLHNETLEDCVKATLKDKVGIDNIYIETNDVFSNIDRIPDTRIVGISTSGIVDTVKANIQFEIEEEAEWFNINEIPKTIYDNGIIIENAIKKLKKQLLNTSYLKLFFPADFTLPELQKIFEQLLDTKLDRRNFRKKILNLDIIEETNDKNVTMLGRPAKLYRFNDNIDKDVF